MPTERKVTEYGNLRWLVPSDTFEDVSYIVDLLDNQCTCPDWDFRKKKTVRPDCKHIQRVKAIFCDRLLDTIRAKVKMSEIRRKQ